MDILHLYLLAGIVVVVGMESVSGQSQARCRYSQTRKMMTANCHGLNLNTIPTLRSEIEVLDFGYNRLGILTNTTFSSYSELKYLYLNENFIKKIEPGAFADLAELEVLDLTNNAVSSLPADMPLPLRKLSLTANTLLALNPNFTLSAFNLNYLSLAECDLKHMPNLGILPSLKELNLTGNNDMKQVTPINLAPFCRLEKLHLPLNLYQGSSSDSGMACQCYQLQTWADEKGIQLLDFKCTPSVNPEAEGCVRNLTEEARVYSACLVAVPPSPAHYTLYAVLAGILLLAAIVLACWWRKSRRKKNSVQDTKRQRAPAHQLVHKNTKAIDTLIT